MWGEMSLPSCGMTPDDAELAFYGTPGRMTTLPDPAPALAGLPVEPDALRAVPAGVLVHGRLGHLYGMRAGEPPMAEMGLRSAAAMLAAVLGKDDRPVRQARPAQRRLRTSCRGFVTLYVALLRRHGVPARARPGFATYFEPGEFGDHWIAEYRGEGGRRWVRTDPQLDAEQIGELGLTFDPGDLPGAAFLSGAEAWRRYREGKLPAERCGVGRHRGAWFIARNVLRDLAALNKVEVLPWDDWGPLVDWTRGGAPDVALVDLVAATVLAGRLDDVRALYDDESALRVPEDEGDVVGAP